MARAHDVSTCSKRFPKCPCLSVLKCPFVVSNLKLTLFGPHPPKSETTPVPASFPDPYRDSSFADTLFNLLALCRVPTPKDYCLDDVRLQATTPLHFHVTHDVA